MRAKQMKSASPLRLKWCFCKCRIHNPSQPPLDVSGEKSLSLFSVLIYVAGNLNPVERNIRICHSGRLQAGIQMFGRFMNRSYVQVSLTNKPNQSIDFLKYTIQNGRKRLIRKNYEGKGFVMLQTIEVEIDAKGHIHPLEKLPLPYKGKSRALLTILSDMPIVRERSVVAEQETPAFGILTATRSVSLEEMETAIHARGSRL